MDGVMSKHLLKPSVLPKKAKRFIFDHIPTAEPELRKNAEIIKVCEPDLSGNELTYLTEAIQSGWISSSGRFVNELEKRFAKRVGVQYAISVTNGTHALHLPLAAMGIGPGDEVIVPAFTMVATANAVRYTGATPIFIDARPDTWNLDESKLEKAITSKTKAIIVVHIYGHPVEMDKVMQIARRHGLWVIEDDAEAHDASYKGRKVGSIGDVGCFSMYANKLVTTGEGGIVVTNNRELYLLMNKLHNHAFSDEIHFWHEYVGYNYRMTNMQAAVGLAQLERMTDFLNKRRRNAKLYLKFLKDVPGVQLPTELIHVTNTYWMFGIVIHDDFPLTRNELRDFLASHGVETRTFFIPMNFQPIFFKASQYKKFPVANMLCKNGLYLPSATSLTEHQIRSICSLIREASLLEPKHKLSTVKARNAVYAN